ncbi:MAG TPA: hypothetical protein VD886_19210 [Herpetosiphonaceae bacterium]|nr:hypothetical protein [Herpetosiphonaceae bacterium]
MDAIDGAALDALFGERSQAITFTIGESDAATGSRVGGTPPSALAEERPACPRCAGPLEYVWTLAGDVLPAAVARGRALSLLCCRDLGCLMASHAPAEPSSLVLRVHADSPRAAAPGPLDSSFEGRRLLAGPPAGEDNDSDGDRSKIGGRPWYLQGDDAGAEERLAASGRGFLLQWSENSYRRDMKRGAYPFLFGVVYVFGRLDPATRLPALEGLQGFWQNS